MPRARERKVCDLVEEQGAPREAGADPSAALEVRGECELLAGQPRVALASGRASLDPREAERQLVANVAAGIANERPLAAIRSWLAVRK